MSGWRRSRRDPVVVAESAMVREVWVVRNQKEVVSSRRGKERIIRTLLRLIT